MLALLSARKLKLDVEKCLKLALIHDINEIYSKDVALWPEDRGTKKERIEENAMKKVLTILPDIVKKDLERAWREIKARKTKEAKLIRDLDKLDMAVQALIYHKAYKNFLLIINYATGKT